MFLSDNAKLICQHIRQERKVVKRLPREGGIVKIILQHIWFNVTAYTRDPLVYFSLRVSRQMLPEKVFNFSLKVMNSVTGLEFSYTQAPKSMKSVVQSFWLLTTCIGNIIDVFFVEIKLHPTQVGECMFDRCILLLTHSGWRILYFVVDNGRSNWNICAVSNILLRIRK